MSEFFARQVEMHPRRERGRDVRDRMRQVHPARFEALSRLLAGHDPLGLVDMGAPEDEYDLEAGTILARLLALEAEGPVSEEVVRQVVHEEFMEWFSPRIAGTEESYSGIAADLWAQWSGVQSEV